MFPRLAEHSFTVGQSVSRTLPAASGGDPALTYSISGQPRGGLTINAAALTLSGTAGLGDAGTYTGHVPVTRPLETGPLLMRILWPAKVGGGGHHGETTQAHA